MEIQKKIWDIVNNAIGLRSSTATLPETVDEDTVESFNTYFTSIGPTVAAQVHADAPTAKMPERVNNSFALPDIDIEEVITAVGSLSAGKAAGPDAIPVRLIKNNIDILAIHLLHIFNHSLANGIYPDELKVARVVPIYKGGERSDPRNYRPISVLNAINTVFEKVLCKRIQNFLNKYNIICHNQHGFRPQRSTSSAVLVLSQLINSALHNNKLAIVVYLDISKAFDTVDHTILQQKLEPTV